MNPHTRILRSMELSKYDSRVWGRILICASGAWLSDHPLV